MRTKIRFLLDWQDRPKADFVLHALFWGDCMKSPRQNKPRKTLLTVDLRELKEPWADWCASRQLTPSEAVRRVLGIVLKSNSTPDVASPGDEGGDRELAGGRRRLQVKLTLAEDRALADLARREGMTVPRWLKGLVRRHVTGAQQFGEIEIETLARSNLALLALGRSINQISRNMSNRTDSDVLTLAQVQFLVEQIKTHREAISALLNANDARWRR